MYKSTATGDTGLAKSRRGVLFHMTILRGPARLAKSVMGCVPFRVREWVSGWPWVEWRGATSVPAALHARLAPTPAPLSPRLLSSGPQTPESLALRPFLSYIQWFAATRIPVWSPYVGGFWIAPAVERGPPAAFA
jgi:hypothetical protein